MAGPSSTTILLVVPAIILASRSIAVQLLIPLLRSENHTKLYMAPNEIRLPTVISLIFLLILRSFAQTVGLGPSLRFTDGGSTSSSNSPRSNVLLLVGHAERLTMPLRITTRELSGYSSSAGSQPNPKRVDNVVDYNAAHIALLLSAVTEPAMLLLIAKRTCPIKPLGAVNVRNTFQILDMNRCRILANSTMLEKGFRIEAVLEKEIVAVKRGYEFAFKVEIVDEGGQSIYRQTFTMLQSHKHEESIGGVQSQAQPSPSTSDISTQLKLVAKDPSNWAMLCKDYNPIHMFSIAPKLFGFPGRIAHGNHVLAKAISALKDDHHTTSILNSRGHENHMFEMKVDFRRPMQVPGVFDVYTTDNAGAVGLVVKKDDKALLESTFLFR